MVRYLQLAHNQWDPVGRQAKAQVIHSFGREDQLDREAIKRLIRSLTRALGPQDALRATAREDLDFVESRPLGGAWVLDHLWHQLGIDQGVKRLLAGRKLDPKVERVLFAWSPTGLCSRSPSSPARSGCGIWSSSPGCPRWTKTAVTGPWTSCWSARRSWPRQSSSTPRSCSTSLSTSCSSIIRLEHLLGDRPRGSRPGRRGWRGGAAGLPPVRPQ